MSAQSHRSHSTCFPAPPLDWLEYIARQVADQQLHAVIQFEGRVDAKRMAQAVRLTLDAEPVLGCRFVPAPRRPYWERRSDLDRLSLCRVIETNDVERALWDWIATPLDPSSDPAVQARLFCSDRDTLCIKMDHVAADAGGTKEYAYFLAHTYRELAANPSYAPAPNLHGDRGMGQVFKRVGPRMLFAAWRRRDSVAPLWGFPSSRSNLGDRAFAVRRIDSVRFDAIKAYAHSDDASINDVLLAAEFRALGALLQPPPGERFALQVSVDLRRYLPSGEAGAIANLASALFPVLEWAPETPFEHTLVQARDTMNVFKAQGPGLGSALYLQLGASVLGFARLEEMVRREMVKGAEAGKSHPFLSNLGLLDERKLRFGEPLSDAFLVGPVLYPPGFMLSASTFRELMLLTCGFCDAAKNQSTYERFFDLLMHELPA
jgi:NRPS condensation-like uncharacterized protein